MDNSKPIVYKIKDLDDNIILPYECYLRPNENELIEIEFSFADTFLESRYVLVHRITGGVIFVKNIFGDTKDVT